MSTRSPRKLHDRRLNTNTKCLMLQELFIETTTNLMIYAKNPEEDDTG